MTVLPLFLTTAATHMHHWLRKVAYDDMDRQASGWVQDEHRIAKNVVNQKPIKLDFGVPKRNRLAWIRRTIHHLPH